MANKAMLRVLLLVALIALTACKPHAKAENKPDDENKEVEHKRTRIVQNPFAPFAIPVLLPEDDGHSENEVDESKSESSEKSEENKVSTSSSV